MGLWKVLAIVVVFLSTTCIAQEAEVDTSTFRTTFDIHVGAGSVGGGRVGVRVRPLENFSIEVGYGASLSNFVGLSDIDKRISFGVNWHEDSSSRFIVSLLGAYARRPVFTNNYSYLVSVNVGTMNMSVSGLHAYARGGLSVEFEHGRKALLGFNFDVGLQFVFP